MALNCFIIFSHHYLSECEKVLSFCKILPRIEQKRPLIGFIVLLLLQMVDGFGRKSYSMDAHYLKTLTVDSNLKHSLCSGFDLNSYMNSTNLERMNNPLFVPRDSCTTINLFSIFSVEVCHLFILLFRMMKRLITKHSRLYSIFNINLVAHSARTCLHISFCHEWFTIYNLPEPTANQCYFTTIRHLSSLLYQNAHDATTF